MLQWLFYIVVVTALLTIAGWISEQAFRTRRWPTRWIWAGTMALSVVIAYLSAAVLFSPYVPHPLTLSQEWRNLQHGAVLHLPVLTSPAVTAVAYVSAVHRSAAIASLWLLSSVLVALALVASAIYVFWRRQRWPLRLLSSACVGIAADTGPAVVGLVRPTIVIPEWVLSRTEGEQALILAHERLHLEAHDPLLLTGGLVAIILMPWNVPLWWQLHRLRHAIEVDCDARVLGYGFDLQAYGETLIEVGQRRSSFVGPVAAMAESRTLLEKRIEIMTRRSRRPWAYGFGVLCSLAIAVAALAAEVTAPDAVGSRSPISGANAVVLSPAADWILIPGGNFVMGATDAQKASAYAYGGSQQWLKFIRPQVEASAPAHDVYLDSFYILRNDVTNAEYGQFAQITGHQRRMPPAGFNGPAQPAVLVTWNDARSYCAWTGARLPTEAEWEKAARGTQGFNYPWGNQWDAENLQSMDRIIHKASSTVEDWDSWRKDRTRTNPEAATLDVGSLPQGASPYGLLDMAGNVWQWVADWFDPTYYANSPGNNPKGPESGDFKVLRGGAWDTPDVVNFSWLRSNWMPPTGASLVTGFRCAKDY